MARRESERGVVIVPTQSQLERRIEVLAAMAGLADDTEVVQAATRMQRAWRAGDVARRRRRAERASVVVLQSHARRLTAVNGSARLRSSWRARRDAVDQWRRACAQRSEELGAVLRIQRAVLRALAPRPFAEVAALSRRLVALLKRNDADCRLIRKLRKEVRRRTV